MSKDRIRLSDPDRLMVLRALLLYVEKAPFTEAWEAYNLARSLAVRPKGPRHREMVVKDERPVMVKEINEWIEQLRSALVSRVG